MLIPDKMLVTPPGGGGFTPSAVRAYLTSIQNVDSNVWEELSLSTKSFDLLNEFNTTDHKFLPENEGYYQVGGSLQADIEQDGSLSLAIKKNGSFHTYSYNANASQIDPLTVNISDLIYFNGTTDYIKLWGYNRYGFGIDFMNGSSNTFLYVYRVI